MYPFGPIRTAVLCRMAPTLVFFSIIPKMMWMLFFFASFSIWWTDGPGIGSASSYERSLQTYPVRLSSGKTRRSAAFCFACFMFLRIFSMLAFLSPTLHVVCAMATLTSLAIWVFSLLFYWFGLKEKGLGVCVWESEVCSCGSVSEF